jgi:hypothetical protein
MLDQSTATVDTERPSVSKDPDHSPDAGPTLEGTGLARLLRGSRGRDEAEAFIARAFRNKHAARVQSFMPELVSFRGGTGELRGVIGLRAARDERLFLEQYLDTPIELAIKAQTGRMPERRDIVEVGNLAGGTCRSAARLVAALPRHLLQREFSWIVFTATTAVQEILRGLDAPLIELASADRLRVAPGMDEWGTYYERDPRVFAGYLPDSRRIPAFQRREKHH